MAECVRYMLLEEKCHATVEFVRLPSRRIQEDYGGSSI